MRTNGLLLLSLGLICEASLFAASSVKKEAQDSVAFADKREEEMRDFFFEDEALAQEVAAKEAEAAKAAAQEEEKVLRIAYQEAAPAPELAPSLQISQELMSRLQVGGSYTYVTLKPHGTPSFHGNLGGMQASYAYRPANRFYGEALLDWKQGSTKGLGGSRFLVEVDLQERLGYTFAFRGDDWMFTLFSGAGYRYLGHHLVPDEGDTLRFNYNEMYIPVGWELDYAVNSWCLVGANFTWMPQLYSTVLIVPLKGARWSLTNPITNFYAEFPVTFTLSKNKRWQLVVNPYYEHWEDGHSTARLSDGTHLGLPGNSYNFWGMDLNFNYQF